MKLYYNAPQVDDEMHQIAYNQLFEKFSYEYRWKLREMENEISEAGGSMFIEYVGKIPNGVIKLRLEGFDEELKERILEKANEGDKPVQRI